MSRWRAVKIAVDEGAVGQGVEDQGHAVAVEADGADHLVVRAKVGVLVVLDGDDLVVVGVEALASRKVAGGAGDAGARGAGAVELGAPEGGVGRGLVGAGVAVVVAPHAGLGGGFFGVVGVGGVAGGAGELAVGG